MKYHIDYYFGESMKTCEVKDFYELESVINFMREKWDESPEAIYPIFEDDLK